jgi:hypothetical protein
MARSARFRGALRASLLGGFASSLVLGLPLMAPVLAQVSDTQVRAANLARMEAEQLNGGLTKYFPANCMYAQGGGRCMVQSNANGYLFQFLGGPPGWEGNKQAATLQTKILIAPDGRTVKSVLYNGVPQ